MSEIFKIFLAEAIVVVAFLTLMVVLAFSGMGRIEPKWGTFVLAFMLGLWAASWLHTSDD